MKPLWLNRVIDWARARYGSSHERPGRQAAHRWVENGTCALSKSWPEYWTNHGVDYPAPHHRPGNPPNWIRAAEYRAHGSAIKRPAPVPWDHLCPPDPVMVQVHTMPKPPCGMVHLIPWRHPGTPPDEVGMVGNHRRWRPVFERQRQNAVRRQRIPWANVIRTVQPAIAGPVVIKPIIGINKAGGRGQVVGVDAIADGKREVDLRGGGGSEKCPSSTEQQKPKQWRRSDQRQTALHGRQGGLRRRHPHPRHDHQKTPIASNETHHVPLSLIAGINPVEFGHGLPAHVHTPATTISLAENQSCIRPCCLYDGEALDLVMVAVLLSNRVGADISCLHDAPAFLILHRQVRITVNQNLICVMLPFSSKPAGCKPFAGCKPIRMRNGPFFHENVQVVLGGEVQQLRIGFWM